MGHEYAGIVEEVGAEVQTIKPDQFVVGSFWATDNTCEICRAGYQSGCVNRVPMGALGAQADLLRVPLADGTLVATPDLPADDIISSLLSASDVLGTGWFGAVAAEAGPGKTVAIVGDGAVGLLALLAAKQLGAERIIAMSRHDARQRLAREFGATDIVEERGDAGDAAIKELTNGLGAHSVVEAVGTQESMMQAIRATRPGGHVGFVGVAHGVAVDGMDLFWSLAHVHGGPAPVRRFLPELIDLIWSRQINPGRSSTSNCRSTKPPPATARWTSARRSRCSCGHDRPQRRAEAGRRRPAAGRTRRRRGRVHHRSDQRHRDGPADRAGGCPVATSRLRPNDPHPAPRPPC
jgi:threonine dehydrogenase-like Zn-dependent dehydrogenase